MSEIRIQKSKLRETYTAVRNDITPEKRSLLDGKIAARLLSSITYRHSQDILLYASKGSEIDTWRIFSDAKRLGKRTYFPKCYDGGIMRYFFVEDRNQLSEGTFGLLEPAENAPEYLPGANAALCVVPGLLFDRDGYRIGYGKGFYDRFLSRFRGVSIGLVYRELLLKRLPRGHYDRHVDIVISEKGVYAVNVSR